jgi:signal transduction histidine kinase/CheY-like chemotaxis protein
MSPEIGADFRATTIDLLQSTSRALILAVGGAYLLCFLATTVWPDEIGSNVLLIAPIIVPTLSLAYYVIPRHFWIAQIMWQAGLMATITLAAWLFGQVEIATLYALLPVMAVVTMGWYAGLLVTGSVACLVWLLAYKLIATPHAAAYSLGLSAAAGFSWLIGWASTRSLLTVTQWSVSSFELARRRAEEALEQRVEFKQTQEDLIQANQELARLSDRLKEMQAVAEEARQAKSQFVANVSHELRTPLNMIVGFSEMITQSPHVYGIQLPPSLLSDIAAIQRNSQHLSKLVDDVLDLSQIEAGHMALSRTWVSLDEIIDEAIAIVRALYESKGLYMRTRISSGLPPVFCDSTRIRQVLINLLSNSGRFTVRGGVTVRTYREDGSIVISVADTGPGIAKEDQARIFEPFEQLDNSIRRLHGGSGLGLSISRQLVELHGGKMWLESELDKGTDICFSLPIGTPPDRSSDGDAWSRWFNPYEQYETRTERSKAPAPVIVPRFVSLDRNGHLPRLLARYTDGSEVVAVQTVDEAIAELNRSPAQALVVNGFSLLQVPRTLGPLASLPYDTPVLTVWVPGEDQAAERFGAARYLVKPVHRDVLLLALDDLDQDIQSILLVDDNAEVLRLFARMLSSAERGYQILRARTGQRAIGLLRERHPDVVILDLFMPGMSGAQVLEEKSRDPEIRDIPVIVISAQDPSGEPMVSEVMVLARGGGLSVQDLLSCITSLGAMLPTPVAPAHPGQIGMPADSPVS